MKQEKTNNNEFSSAFYFTAPILTIAAFLLALKAKQNFRTALRFNSSLPYRSPRHRQPSALEAYARALQATTEEEPTPENNATQSRGLG